MNTTKLSSNKQAELLNKYFDGQDVTQFSKLPAVESLQSALAKRCFAMINANRGARQEIVNSTKDVLRFKQVMFALNTLFSLGYDQQIITVNKDDIVWRNIHREPTFERYYGFVTYAVPNKSRKMKANVKYRVMVLRSTNPKLPNGYHPVIFLHGNDWYLAYKSGSPFVTDKTDNFSPWEEPYPTYLQDGIIIELEQNPKH